MLSIVASKNVSWPRLIWPTMYTKLQKTATTFCRHIHWFKRRWYLCPRGW